MAETLLEKITLKNGLTVNLFDASQNIAGDRQQVNLIVRVDIYIDSFEQAINGNDNSLPSFAEIKEILGDSIVFELVKQRQFIDNKEKQKVIKAVTDSFKQNTRKRIIT